ncbi:hypothetical protein Vretimale_3005 [Volvox reticuliferus]|uniref:Uncharacterized protein n=2 Tax=Volvox reticuliferus TaxID=1737510 RepID=A0A8J4FZS9_9CHLO|nr:hypothetical protein Vretifemale_6871 [Volvox reticuliferus]GIL97284.1 hypothetical protein Vretimale_3005 [Volvox reticuliferus]
MYGYCTDYTTVSGSIKNLLNDGIFCRDAMVPPGWIAFPNRKILPERGVKTLHKQQDTFLMAHQAAEQGMLMFDASGYTCRERLISCIIISKKSDTVTYVKYSDRR